jgi:hypothetical protein
MAQAKGVYAPLHITTYGRGAPLSSGGGSAPIPAKSGMGGKMASALGSMMDQALEAEQVSKEQRAAQLRARNLEVAGQIPTRFPAYNTGEYNNYPITLERTYKDEDNTVQKEYTLNPDYVPRPNPYYDAGVGEPTQLELELFDNERELRALEGTETRSSGFVNPKLNNKILYPYKKSKYFEDQPSVKADQGNFGNLLRFVQS